MQPKVWQLIFTMFLLAFFVTPCFVQGQTPKKKVVQKKASPSFEDTKKWIIKTLEDNSTDFYDPDNGTAKKYTFKFRGSRLIINYTLSINTGIYNGGCDVSSEVDLMNIDEIEVEYKIKNSITFISGL